MFFRIFPVFTSILILASIQLGAMDLVGSAEVRITRGRDFFGVVQFHANGTWHSLCPQGFGPKDAELVCRKLRFKNGLALKMRTIGQPVYPNIQCVGNESSVLECQYGKGKPCTDTWNNAGVICFNHTMPSVRKKIIPPRYDSGLIEVQVDNSTYTFCGHLWGSGASRTACKQLGFNGGMDRSYPNGNGTMFGVNIRCDYNDRSIFSCTWFLKVDSRCLDDNTAAGVTCYRGVSLTGGWENDTMIAGVVKKYYPGAYTDWFTLGPAGFDEREAEVVCHELGFRYFKVLPLGIFGAKGIPKFHKFKCRGEELSIGHCEYENTTDVDYSRTYACMFNLLGECENRWTSLTYDYSSVVCSVNPIGSTGIKVIRVDHSTKIVYVEKHGIKGVIYPGGWDGNDAQVVCRQQGYKTGYAIAPKYAGPTYPYWMSNVQCNGTEGHIESCIFDETPPLWKAHSFRDFRSAARAQCIRDSGIRVLPIDHSTKIVYLEKDGIKGVIYPGGWDDNDAQVICRQQGYTTGIAIGPKSSGPTDPYWMSNVQCNGTEGHIETCIFDETPPLWKANSFEDFRSAARLQCSDTDGHLKRCPFDESPPLWKAHSFRDLHSAARVHCINDTLSGVDIQLETWASSNSGMVKVSVGGEWGTICDSNWTDIDARVACRQLGFNDGLALTKHYKPLGTGPKWLNGIECSGEEKSIFSCPGRFNADYGHYAYCMPYVFCTEKVRLRPSVTFGAVQVWDRDTYHLVCADGFDDNAARAVCRSLGFAYGKSICCSAFGRMEYSIGYNNIKCTGNETNFLDCEYVKYSLDCTSGDYASVACSNNPQNEGYDLHILSSGKVTIRYFDNPGYICANGFDDTEATVVCRERGFKRGHAYYHSKHTKYNTAKLLGVPWLSNIACEGSENYLGQCKNIKWGSVGSCDGDRIAAVYCFNETGFELTLVNGTDNDNGLVVFTVDGKDGAICTEDRQLAAIVCKQLGYRNGSYMYQWLGEAEALERFPGKSDMFITKLECNGNETSLVECMYRILEDGSTFPENWIGITSAGCRSWSCMRERAYGRMYAFIKELSCSNGKRRLAVKCFL